MGVVEVQWVKCLIYLDTNLLQSFFSLRIIVRLAQQQQIFFIDYNNFSNI
jgi:hypothetical protein